MKQTETEQGDRTHDDPGDVDAVGRAELLDALDAAVASDGDHQDDLSSELADPTDDDPGAGPARRRVLRVVGGIAAAAGHGIATNAKGKR